MKFVARMIIAGALPLGVLFGSAIAANAAQSWVYQGSCGNGCFKYSNGSSNLYIDKWMGLTFNQNER